jgi:rRNA methylases
MRKITNEELNRPSAGEFAAMEKMPVAVVLDNVRSLQNVGAFFRTGDAFAVERIALCGITATPPNRDIHKTALGAELTVPWTYHKTTEECIARLRAEGYRVYAVEQVEGAVMLGDFRAEPGVKYALVFGNEVMGVGQQGGGGGARGRGLRPRGRSRFRRPGRSIRSTFRFRAVSFCGIFFAKSGRSVNFAALNLGLAAPRQNR